MTESTGSELSDASKAAMRYAGITAEEATALPTEVAARLQDAEQQQAAAAARPTGPCPDWCREGDGHVLEPHDENTGMRVHDAPLHQYQAAERNGFTIGLSQVETVGRDDVVTRESATVHVEADLTVEDPATLRFMARRLNEAADALTQVQAVRYVG